MEITNLLLSPVFAVPLLLLIVLYSFIFLRPKTRRSLPPPGPTKLPLIGNLHQLGDDPLLHRSLHRLSNKHGPLMQLQLGSIPTVIVSSAEFIKEIFKFHDLTFSSRPPMYAAKKIGYGFSDIAFAPYGDYWREIRKIAVLELLSTKRVQTFQSIRSEELCLLLDRIVCSSLDGKSFDLSQAMLTLSNNFVCRVAFGKKWDSDDCTGGDRIEEVMMETQTLLGEVNLADFYPWLGWAVNKFNGVDKRLNDNFQKLDKFFNEVIEEHRIRRARIEVPLDHKNIIDVLLRVQSDPNQAIRLTDNQIKGVLADIFIAGTDTTAATVVWTMAELIRNRSILKKVQEELRQFVKGNNNNNKRPQVSESDLFNNFLYLKMVIKESLRLHPPVPLLLPRETTQPSEIGGYHLPAKTRVFVNTWTISRDPDYWVDANRFNPERFSDEFVDYRGQDFGFIPFGVGRRICPGMNFAMVMVELVLANLLSEFDWELPGGTEDVDMDEAIGSTSHKKIPLVLLAYQPGSPSTH